MPPQAASTATGTITRNPAANKKHPMAIFPTAEGSVPFRDCLAQNEVMSGVSRIMNAGFNDWNQEAGNSHPSTYRSVLASAHIAMVLPCCSYAAHKAVLLRQIAISPHTRPFSVADTLLPTSRFSLSSIPAKVSGASQSLPHT